ncbi:hypothetical protein LWI29_025146 [Acer saccharum]|uniref:Uncharacterized protein n=1 Tax=Acer saccharum TaxID=4024 RepID=A0AA39RZN4_ACESA|nr:hypothetical protein LWI29_025146 [Acer saccharum]
MNLRARVLELAELCSALFYRLVAILPVTLVKVNEFRLKKELGEARNTFAILTLGSEKLNHMLSIGKMPNDKRGLGFIDDESTPSSDKTIFVKEFVPKLPPLSQHPMRKIKLGESSKSGQMKMPTKS